MTDPQDLLRLADELEKATGPDRELDARIAPLVGLTVVDEGHPIGRMCYDDIGAAHLLPRFTASLDAAMSLVPEGWRWNVSHLGHYCRADVYSPDHDWGALPPSAVAATSSLALCAAALKARAHSTKESDNG